PRTRPAPIPCDAPVTTATFRSVLMTILRLGCAISDRDALKSLPGDLVRPAGPLRPTTAERVRVKRDELPDARRRPAGHPLHPVRLPVVPARPVQLAHRHHVLGHVLRQPRPLQSLLPVPGECPST